MISRILTSYAISVILFLLFVPTENYSRSIENIHADTTSPEDNSHADYDGPYIIYKNDIVIVKQVLKKENIFFAKTDTILPADKTGAITCYYDEKISFSTRLKEKLLIEASVYDSPEKFIAISDIEGNFIPFRDFLINNKVIDSDNRWTFGSGHLVIIGDVFDRGLNVTECLWFIYHLEQEAVKNDGYVHFILGNHEIMNLNGNVKYVRNKYIENSKLIGEDYKNLYKPGTELGRWLETKNIVEKIGAYLFVHGGIAEELNGLNVSIETINSAAREYYYNSKLARQSSDTLIKILFSSKLSPFWYRGLIDETIQKEILNKIITDYNISKVVAGHTIVEDVSYFYDKKVIGIDTDHANSDSEGLLIENGIEYRIDKSGNRYIIYSR